MSEFQFEIKKKSSKLYCESWNLTTFNKAANIFDLLGCKDVPSFDKIGFKKI
jgi:hypothetical protein